LQVLLAKTSVNIGFYSLYMPWVLCIRAPVTSVLLFATSSVLFSAALAVAASEAKFV
jgi:hypothetical protein